MRARRGEHPKGREVTKFNCAHVAHLLYSCGSLDLEPRRVKREIPSVESLIIHIEPKKQERIRVAIPVLEDKGMDSPVTPHFGEAPYFLFVDVEGESIHRWFTRHNPALGLDRKRGVTVSELINGEDTTTLLTAEIGEGPFRILRDSFIEIYELPEKTTVKKAVNSYLEGKLKRMEETSEGKNRSLKPF